MKRVVVLTGAGMSAESGLKTFRDSDGLWENYDVMEVASIEGWHRNPSLVQQFYNDRRRQLWEAKPNQGHFDIASLEENFHVDVITQNVDDLHERAGSHHVIHLHGELKKIRSSRFPHLVYELGPNDPDVQMGDLCEKGTQLRPDIVWFGEAVPMMDPAIKIVSEADIVLIVGTSLSVYPAASLMNFAPSHAKIYLVDPKRPSSLPERVDYICAKASEGVAIFRDRVKNNIVI